MALSPQNDAEWAAMQSALANMRKQDGSVPLSVAHGSTAELIAARELLRRWIARYAPGNKPGGWDYDKNVVELIETSAALLGIEDPWRQ